MHSFQWRCIYCLNKTKHVLFKQCWPDHFVSLWSPKMCATICTDKILAGREESDTGQPAEKLGRVSLRVPATAAAERTTADSTQAGSWQGERAGFLACILCRHLGVSLAWMVKGLLTRRDWLFIVREWKVGGVLIGCWTLKRGVVIHKVGLVACNIFKHEDLLNMEIQAWGFN